MKHILLLSFFFCSAYANAQCVFENFYQFYPPLAWHTKTIATSDGGSVTVTGACYDSLNPGHGNGQDEDLCIVKTDACGNTLWTNHCGYPGEGDDACDVVEMENGDYLVTGYAAFQQAFGNIRVACFGKNGQFKWDKLYSGNQVSNPYSIIKRKHTNTYIVSGHIEYSSSVYKGYILEMNDTGKVLKNAILNVPSNASVFRIFELNDSVYLMVASIGDSVCLVQTDTLFNIQWIKCPFNGIMKEVGFRDACLSYDQKNVVFTLSARILPSAFSERLIACTSIDGEFIKYKAIEDSFPNFTYIISTPGNGYIIGSNLLYTDSNFNYLGYYSYWGAALGSVVYNEYSKHVFASGISFLLDTVFTRLCIIGTDSSGRIIHNPVKEVYPEQAEPLRLYPNPASDMVHVASGSGGPYRVAVYNTTGQCVYSGEVQGTAVISTSGFAAGIYVVQVQQQGKVVMTHKLSIMR